MESLKFTREEKELLGAAVSNEISSLLSLIDRLEIVDHDTQEFVDDLEKYQKLLQKIRESYKYD